MTVGRLWPWIPTFRAVAEREHLSQAARALGVSPSAVSRTIGLLEQEVGQPLFARVGRRVELNAAGRHLLLAVRSATREVEEALTVLGSVFKLGGLLRPHPPSPSPWRERG
jgi:DNA-binding transcriptional LysR family regulator